MKKFIVAGIFIFLFQNAFNQCTFSKDGRTLSYNIGATINDNGVAKRCECLDKIKPGEKCLSANWVIINAPKPPPINPPRQPQSSQPQKPQTQSQPQSSQPQKITIPSVSTNLTGSIIILRPEVGEPKTGEHLIKVIADEFAILNALNKEITIKFELTCIRNKKITTNAYSNKTIIPNSNNYTNNENFYALYKPENLGISLCDEVELEVTIYVYYGTTLLKSNTPNKYFYCSRPCALCDFGN